MSVKNIERVLAQADEVDTHEGLLAYEHYNETLHRIAKHYGHGFVQTVAAFVSLSPQNDYFGNLRSLVTLMKGMNEGKTEDECTISTYNHCRSRAWQYLLGERDFLMDVKGPKVKSFYHNIILPKCSRHITIDGHMFNVYTGKVIPLKEVANAKFSYADVSYQFKKVARRHNILPNQLQAILWFTWKRMHNIVYNPQMNFTHSSHWRNLVEPEEILPYESVRQFQPVQDRGERSDAAERGSSLRLFP